MGVKKGLSVQFYNSAVTMMYIEKDLRFVQRKKINQDNLEEIITEMIENLRSKINETHMERIDTYITLPNEKVRTYSLLKFPDFEGIKGSKLKQALQLHLENELEIKLDKPIYYYHTYETESEKLVTVSIVDEKEIGIYPKIFFEKRFNLVNIQLESDAIREYAIQNNIISSEGTNVFVHFFFDGEEKQVGFYIYKGEFLAAIRYLPMDYYNHYNLKKELDVVVTDCGEKIENFKVDTYYVISENKADYKNLKEFFENQNLKFLYEKYPASKGILQIQDIEEKGGIIDGKTE